MPKPLPLCDCTAVTLTDRHHPRCVSITGRIPDIDFLYPPCPICCEDLTLDAGWYCPHREVFWSQDGTSGLYTGDEQVAA